MILGYWTILDDIGVLNINNAVIRLFTNNANTGGQFSSYVYRQAERSFMLKRILTAIEQ